MRVPESDARARSGRDLRKDVAVGVALLYFATVLIRDTNVPLLAYVDLGFHELGHLLTYPLPDLLTAVAGSFTQVAVPLGLAAYFLLFRQDDGASALCLGWAATSAYNAATYVADAPYERLQLIGGDHDWAFILFELDQMALASPLATAIRVFAWLLIVVAATILVLPYARPWLRDGH